MNFIIGVDYLGTMFVLTVIIINQLILTASRIQHNTFSQTGMMII